MAEELPPDPPAPRQMKRSTQGVFFGEEFVPAGTVLPIDHPYTEHPSFVDYRPPSMDVIAPPPA